MYLTRNVRVTLKGADLALSIAIITDIMYWIVCIWCSLTRAPVENSCYILLVIFVIPKAHTRLLSVIKIFYILIINNFLYMRVLYKYNYKLIFFWQT